MLRLAIFTSALVATAALTGCGAKFNEVKGTVKLDGNPIEGATVTLISDDGKKSFSGLSDASGNFEIKSGDKPGAPAGSYKVTVVKTKAIPGAATMEAGGADYMKMMQGKAKEADKSGPGKGPAPPPGFGGSKSAADKSSELPAQYGAATSTPLTATVPLSGPLNLDLASGKK